MLLWLIGLSEIVSKDTSVVTTNAPGLARHVFLIPPFQTHGSNPKSTPTKKSKKKKSLKNHANLPKKS